MSEQQVLQKHNPDADRQMLAELKAMLDAEIQKPYSKRNYDLMAELSAAITDATITKAKYEESINKGLEIQQHIIQKRKEKKHRWVRPLAVACSCLVILLVSNALAIHVTGSNLLELTYSIFDDRVEFQYPSSESSHSLEFPATEDDPYGIRAECEKDGFSPLVPHYLPEGFVQDQISHSNGKQIAACSFVYRNGKELISLEYRFFYDEKSLTETTFGIPSDKHNITELDINGIKIVISKEDGQFTSVFTTQQVSYTLYTENLAYEESEKILHSLFE